MKPILPLPILGWTALVFVASFLNWARIPLGRTIGHPQGQDPILTLPTFGLPSGIDPVHEVTAWTARYSFFGVELPLWLVCVAALLVAVVSLLKAFGAMTPESARRTAGAAAVAGFLHVAGFFWLMLMLRVSPGFGALATAVGMFALSVLVIRGTARRPPAKPSCPADHDAHHAAEHGAEPAGAAAGGARGHQPAEVGVAGVVGLVRERAGWVLPEHGF